MRAVFNFIAVTPVVLLCLWLELHPGFTFLVSMVFLVILNLATMFLED